MGSIFYSILAVTLLPFASLSLFIYDRQFYSGEAASRLYTPRWVRPPYLSLSPHTHTPIPPHTTHRHVPTRHDTAPTPQIPPHTQNTKTPKPARTSWRISCWRRRSTRSTASSTPSSSTSTSTTPPSRGPSRWPPTSWCVPCVALCPASSLAPRANAMDGWMDGSKRDLVPLQMLCPCASLSNPPSPPPPPKPHGVRVYPSIHIAALLKPIPPNQPNHLDNTGVHGGPGAADEHGLHVRAVLGPHRAQPGHRLRPRRRCVACARPSIDRLKRRLDTRGGTGGRGGACRDRRGRTHGRGRLRRRALLVTFPTQCLLPPSLPDRPGYVAASILTGGFIVSFPMFYDYAK